MVDSQERAAAAALNAGFVPICLGAGLEDGWSDPTPKLVDEKGKAVLYNPSDFNLTPEEARRWDRCDYSLGLDAVQASMAAIQLTVSADATEGQYTTYRKFVLRAQGKGVGRGWAFMRESETDTDDRRVTYIFRAVEKLHSRRFRLDDGAAEIKLISEGIIVVRSVDDHWESWPPWVNGHGQDIPPWEVPALDWSAANNGLADELIRMAKRCRVEIKDLDEPSHPQAAEYVSFSDAQLAESIIPAAVTRLRYDARSQKPVMYQPKQGLWRMGMATAATDVVRPELARASSYVSQTLDRGDLSKQERKQLSRAHSRLSSNACERAVEDFLKRDRRLRVKFEDAFDVRPFQLHCPGGIIDLQSGQLLPHDRYAFHSKTTGVTPASSASRASRWLQFLGESICDVETERYLQKLFGQALLGVQREQKLPFIYGPGGEGKTTFQNAILHAVGDYGAQAPSGTLTSSGKGRHSTDVAGLMGARIVFASETDAGEAWNEVRVKALTGGDRMRARFLYEDYREFQPQFQIVVLGNHRPHIERLDDAMMRRILIIPFTKKPERPDASLGEKLQAEAPGILRWMLDGLSLYLDEGLGDPPTAISRATGEYFDDEDLVGRWFEECCEIVPVTTTTDPNATLTTADAFESWKSWCYRNGQADAIGSSMDMKERMRPLAREMDFEEAKKVGPEGARRSGFIGVRLKSVADELVSAEVVQ